MNLMTHALFSLAMGEVLSLNIIGILIGGLIPDLDYLIGLPHRTLTHSILFVLILSFILYKRNKRFGISLFIGLLSHLLLDVVTTQGVMLLYPFSKFYSFNLFNSSKSSINLLIICLSFVTLWNKDLINYKLSKLDSGNVRLFTYSVLIIPLLVVIPLVHLQESECIITDLSHIITHVEEFDEECVVVNGMVCSEVEDYTSSTVNTYEIFTLCNTGMSVKVWLLKSLSPGLEQGDNITITGLFTTKYLDSSGYEIYMIKEVEKD